MNNHTPAKKSPATATDQGTRRVVVHRMGLMLALCSVAFLTQGESVSPSPAESSDPTTLSNPDTLAAALASLSIPETIWLEDYPTLSLDNGDQALAVDALQKLLVRNGFRHAPVWLDENRNDRIDTGEVTWPITQVFDEETAEQVRRFQESLNLVVDGIVGPNTWRALGVYLPMTPMRPAAEAETSDSECGC